MITGGRVLTLSEAAELNRALDRLRQLELAIGQDNGGGQSFRPTSVQNPDYEFVIAKITGIGSTTVSASISAGSNTCTPASMTGIINGGSLLIDNGTGVKETVAVTDVTSVTFTATFANAHGVNFIVVPLPATYAWTEEFFDGSGAYVDLPGGRSGTATYMPAMERNGQIVTAFPFYALLRERIYVGGAPYFEFDAPGSAGSTVTVVTEVCPIYGTDTALYTGQSFTSGDILTGSIDAPTGIGAGGIIQGQVYGF